MGEKCEIEFKWSVKKTADFEVFLNAARRLGAAIKPARRIINKDYYFDTADAALAKSKITCRIRNCGGSYEFTVKYASRLKNGLAKRGEIVIKLGRVNSYISALKKAGPFMPPIAALRKKLYPIFRIINKRTVIPVKLSGGGDSEACFDDVVIYAGGKKIKMKEIELEFLHGNSKKFISFGRLITKTSALIPAVISKVATARLALAEKI